MSNITFNPEELLRRLSDAAQNIDLRRAGAEIRQIVLTSIDRNFQVGGRYSSAGGGEYTGGTQRWRPSKDPFTDEDAQVIVGMGKAAAKRYARSRGQTLVQRGLLVKSIDVRVGRDYIEATADRVYAAIHHYGGTINHPGGTAYVIVGRRSAKFSRGQAKFISNRRASELEAAGVEVRRTRPHPITIPARPYVVIQDEDLVEIAVALSPQIGL